MGRVGHVDMGVRQQTKCAMCKRVYVEGQRMVIEKSELLRGWSINGLKESRVIQSMKTCSEPGHEQH